MTEQGEPPPGAGPGPGAPRAGSLPQRRPRADAPTEAFSYQRRWETRGERRRGGGRSAGDAARTSYYDLPVIKVPHWSWLVSAYFFLGGITGMSYLVATVADVLGGSDNRRIARAGRYLSLVALLPCPPLLILDLGRPERFLYMLRVVKLRSPMSLGTWGLLLFSLFSTVSAAIQGAQDGLFGRRTAPARLLRALPARTIGVLGAGPAVFVAGYTGVLLGATAVPLWTRHHHQLGPLFRAAALSSATAALTAVLAPFPGAAGARRRLARLNAVALAAELALHQAARARSGETIWRPMETGRLGRLDRFGVLGLGLGVPLAVQVLGLLRWRGRGASLPAPLAAATAALVLAGGALFRYVLVMAGKASAADPQATFALTRAPSLPGEVAGREVQHDALLGDGLHQPEGQAPAPAQAPPAPHHEVPRPERGGPV
jgi:formate-dependent nitrite reductase membrane component NrfD